jgi:hypothetical protein
VVKNCFGSEAPSGAVSAKIAKEKTSSMVSALKLLVDEENMCGLQDLDKMQRQSNTYIRGWKMGTMVFSI